MLAELRRRVIRAEIRRTGSVQTFAIARQLGVSDMTISRDVDALHEEGLLCRVRGGAVRLDTVSVEDPAVNGSPDDALVDAAMELVTEGMVVGLTAGGQLSQLNEALCAKPGVTIVSNSLLCARIIDERRSHGLPRAHLILTGGTRIAPHALVGPVTIATLSKLYTDISFLQVSGVNAVEGFACRTAEEAQVIEGFAHQTSQTVVVAPNHILGVRGTWALAAVDRVDVLIMAVDSPAELRQALRGRARSTELVPMASDRYGRLITET